MKRIYTLFMVAVALFTAPYFVGAQSAQEIFASAIPELKQGIVNEHQITFKAEVLKAQEAGYLGELTIEYGEDGNLNQLSETQAFDTVGYWYFNFHMFELPAANWTFRLKARMINANAGIDTVVYTPTVTVDTRQLTTGITNAEDKVLTAFIANQKLNVNATGVTLPAGYDVTLYNLLGTQVLNQHHDASVSIDISDMAAGIYIAQLTQGTKVTTVRLTNAK